MSKRIDIQYATSSEIPATEKDMIKWVKLTLEPSHTHYELTLRFVDEGEIKDLNRVYRQQDKTTNVLAFPSNLPETIQKHHPFLGDVIVCPAVLAEEAKQQHKVLIEHWAHIIIHGVLHLLGYDHIKEKDAQCMQAKEIELLAAFGYKNPYDDEDERIEHHA